jgi:hypothetical protein
MGKVHEYLIFLLQVVVLFWNRSIRQGCEVHCTYTEQLFFYNVLNDENTIVLHKYKRTNSLIIKFATKFLYTKRISGYKDPIHLVLKFIPFDEIFITMRKR